MLEFTIFFAAFLLTAIGVSVFKRLRISERLRDIPNERSSHVKPIPRGGGIIIVVVCLGLYMIAATATGRAIYWAYVTAGLAIAAVSWLDDLRSLPAWVRFCVHAAASLVLIAGCGWVSDVYIPLLGTYSPGFPAGALLTVIWLVWMTNAYNFMDGIDGIAGTQAVVAGAAWLVVGLLRSDGIEFVYGGIIAFAAVGFLLHNWQPASVFMGDVGSAFLGFTLAAIPLLSVGDGPLQSSFGLYLSALFLWPFVFDTVYTFLRRMLKGERVWEAHRSHIYQRLVLAGYSHSYVSLMYGVLGAATATTAIAAYYFGNLFGLFALLAGTGTAVFPLFIARRKKV